MRKNCSIRVYNPTTNRLLKEWTNIKFNSFTKEINAGLGECTFELLEKFDYGGGELALGNMIDVVISDIDTSSAGSNGYGATGWFKVYTGYISMYEPNIGGAQESIMVHALGWYTQLSTDILKNGSQTTLYTDSTGTNGLKTGTGPTAADAGHVMRAILTRYAAETATPKLSALSIPAVSNTLKYVFNQKSYREALDIAKSTCPSGYFWYIDQFGAFTLKQQATTPKHIFILNKHATNLHVQRSMEKIRNICLIWDGAGGGNYKKYEDTNSVTLYGRRVQTLTDPSLEDATSMANIAAKFLAEHAEPDIQVQVTIMDNNTNPLGAASSEKFGYDIENIEPGETCRFMGFNEEFANIFRDSLLITRVEYYLDRAVLTIENFKSDIVDQTKKNEDAIDVVATDGIPDSYT